MTANQSGIRDNHRFGKVGDFLNEKIQPEAQLRFVSAYFSIFGFEALREQLLDIDKLQFLFGEPTFVKQLDVEQSQAKAFDVVEQNLWLSNRLEQKAIAKTCADWIAEKVEIRSLIQTNLLHGKLYGKENGNKIVDERQWHSSVKESDDYRQEIFGENLSRYSYSNVADSFIKYGKHLAGYVDLKYFVQPRVLIREITNPCVIASYIEEEYVNDPQIINIVPKNAQSNLKYLLGLLNSKLATFYHFNSSPKATKGAFPKILVTDIKNFPIPKISESKQQPFITLVDKILANKKAGNDTSALEREIDVLVYGLYGLSEDEINIVEGK
jgi:hypothetical protein